MEHPCNGGGKTAAGLLPIRTRSGEVFVVLSDVVALAPAAEAAE